MKSLVVCLGLPGSAALAQPASEVAALGGESQRGDGRPLAVGDRLDIGTPQGRRLRQRLGGLD